MISVVNYKMGNIRSVINAVAHLGFEVRVADTAADIARADKLILPGVGSYYAAMKNLASLGMIEPLHEAVLGKKRLVLGICLGMQLLADSGEEDGTAAGLGWIPGEVCKLPAASDLKVPHIGFNTAKLNEHGYPLFDGLGASADFYFVHSYVFKARERDTVTSWTDYGGLFASSVSRDNIHGMQFHPEKSQSNGLRVLQNFAKL